MPTTYQDVRRAAEAIKVFHKQGLGPVLAQLGITKHIPLLHRYLKKRIPSDAPQRLREALEQLGGAYLKFGQFLSLRPDIIPREYCRELRNLLDQVPPVPFQTISKIIKSEVGETYKHLEETPLGSASIAQVHKAELKNGRRTVVKVIKPGVAQQFEEDIDILEYLAKISEKHVDHIVSPTSLVQEFKEYTKRELNLVYEGRIIDKFHKHFKDNKLEVPQVHWQATTARVLTMDYLPGITLREALQKQDLAEYATEVSDSIFEQVFHLRIFHADMHPGNILLTPKKKLALLDYGIVGYVDPLLARQGMDFLLAAIMKDMGRVSDILVEVGSPQPSFNETKFRREIREVLSEWYDPRYGRARFTNVLQELFSTSTKNKLEMPRDFILLGKAVVTGEGTVLTLDPDFDFEEEAKKQLKKIAREQYSPQNLAKQAVKGGREIIEDLLSLPTETRDIIRRLKRGDLALDLRHTDIRHLGWDVEMSSNRLSYAVLVASLILAGSLLANTGPSMAGVTVIPALLFIGAAGFTIPLIYSIVREGKGRDYHRFVRKL